MQVYEELVRLITRTGAPIKRVFNFVGELRQNSHFNIMRLSANQQDASIDISLRLRELVPLKYNLLQMADVSQVIEPYEPPKEVEEKVFRVSLGG